MCRLPCAHPPCPLHNVLSIVDSNAQNSVDFCTFCARRPQNCNQDVFPDDDEEKGPGKATTNADGIELKALESTSGIRHAWPCVVPIALGVPIDAASELKPQPLCWHSNRHSILYYRQMAVRQLAGETKSPVMLEWAANNQARMNPNFEDEVSVCMRARTVVSMSPS